MNTICACGCGGLLPTTPASKPGHRFIRGHNQRLRAHLPRRKRPVEERFLGKVSRSDDSCPTWHGTLSRTGYGVFRYEGRMQLAHRVAWLLAGRPIPAGFHIHHECSNPLCVNVDHLRPVDAVEHQRIGARRRDVCRRGHAQTVENTYVYELPDGRTKRNCRLCHLMRMAQRK